MTASLLTPVPTAAVPAVLTTRGLEKWFGDVHAVRGLDLNVERGQVYGFLGPNGAGKTTTIRMLLGLVRPSAGEVQLLGQPLHRQRASALARVGALVESPSAYGHLTGLENLEVARRLLNAPRANVPRLLDLVGLRDAAHRAVRGYSLGMRGRLSLAAALLNDPQLLLLDEPTNGLDPAGIREVRDLIAGLPARGTTVIVSSHLLSEIEQLATQVGIIVRGRMRFEGTLAALRAHTSPCLTLEVDRPEAALALLHNDHLHGRVRGGSLELQVRPEEAAAVNRRLVEAGFAVSSLTTTPSTLEDLFFRFTETTDD